MKTIEQILQHDSEEPLRTLAESGIVPQEVLEGIATDSIGHALCFSTKAREGEPRQLLMEFHDACAAWFGAGMPKASEKFFDLLERVHTLMVDLGQDVKNRALWAVYLREFSLLHMCVNCKSGKNPGELYLDYDSEIEHLGLGN